MVPGCLEHCNTEGTPSEYSRNIACRLGNNPSIFLNKTPPVWAKGLFITIKDFCAVTHSSCITADEFI